MNWIPFLLIFMSFQTLGSATSVPLNDENFSKKPPQDLVLNNTRLDTYEALKLQRTGTDLSALNPYESTLWQNKKHKLLPPKIKTTSFEFEDYKASPTEIFRSIIVDPSSSQRFTLTASLDNHSNILRAALLRLTGYDVALPEFKETITLNFC